MNIAMLLEMAANDEPERTAVGSHGAPVSYSTLQRRAAGLADRLLGTGVERIGYLGLNSPGFPTAVFGAAMAGLPFAPVNYRLGDDQLRSIVSRLAPAVVVVDAGMAERVGEVDGVEYLPVTELDREVDGLDAPFVDPDDISVLLFTSGTTGEPKAAVLRHRHLCSYILESVEFMGASEDESQLVSVPPYHIAGISTVLSSVFSGRRIVYLEAFDPEAWVHTAARERITQAMVVPTMLARVLSVLETTGTELPDLRHLSYGGGRMPVDVIQRAMEQLPHVAFVNAYGLTETSSTVSVLGPDDHRQALADEAVRARLGSVGQPLPSVEVEIRDETGAALAPGQRGEIFVRGSQVSGEYLGRNVLTEDGWFPTNDAGYLDEDGFLYLDGRLDDVIVRGGENLSPGEIEDLLRSHPSVTDAGVVGIPDPEWGEAVAAAVVVRDPGVITEADLQEFVRERARSTRTPTVIDFRDELPYNETGKLLRRLLREELAVLADKRRS